MRRTGPRLRIPSPLIPTKVGMQRHHSRTSAWVPAFAGTSGRWVLASLVATAALAGCGLRGDLTRPMPMWGDPPRIDADDPRTLKENEERAAAERARAEAEREAARQAEMDELRRAGETLETPPATPPQ